MSNRITAIGGLVLAGTLAWSQANAATFGGHHANNSAAGLLTQTVPIADLDLSQEQGVKTLMVRLDMAATQVCGPKPVEHYRQDLQISAEMDRIYSSCMQQAKDRAVADINKPLVTAYYKGGQGISAAVHH
jgi:UrcA family protein